MGKLSIGIKDNVNYIKIVSKNIVHNDSREDKREDEEAEEDNAKNKINK